ncbi:hypothetical protein L9F63_027990 [Diploptera punctata]|uniref:Uncharacterized protein n=1 Tax=Diploptera punctata TaxID=6984 RepID=A0AAD8EH04_DIPPU|nr:hypothetical protein L9F63_027990 [Diploptera punctata]
MKQIVPLTCPVCAQPLHEPAGPTQHSRNDEGAACGGPCVYSLSPCSTSSTPGKLDASLDCMGTKSLDEPWSRLSRESSAILYCITTSSEPR